MASTIRNVIDVAERHLCTGCGACAFAIPELIEMVDDLDAGRRPLLKRGANPESTSGALAVCPGHHLEHVVPFPADGVPALADNWGPVIQLWEGHASDEEIRHLGSSGGIATALSVFAIEEEHWAGVLHIAARDDVPYLNATRLSSSREEILGAAGSRYAPASPCDKLHLVKSASAPCLMIGKPCDVAAAGMAARQDPALREKLGLTIGIFCAGTPSTRATLELAGQLGAEDPSEIGSVQYRGMGWPGRFRLQKRDGSAESASLSYTDSWGQLQSKRQWRCYVCADHTGEFADISVGDPWYDGIPDDAPGRSLVIVRTPRGRAFLQRALELGAVTLKRVGPELLEASQPNLLTTRGAVWGRAWICRLLGAPAPRYPGMRLGRLWMTQLTLRQKFSSIVGTARRVFRKRLRGRRSVVEYNAAGHSTQGGHRAGQ